jgi:hypothetical protein
VTRKDREVVHAALAARLDECWERLDDAVCELAALHGVSAETIVERVRDVHAAEDELQEATAREA